jgi:hypothetical protein
VSTSPSHNPHLLACGITETLFCRLTKLNLSQNVIESSGAHKLAFSLRSNATLKGVRLLSVSLNLSDRFEPPKLCDLL